MFMKQGYWILLSYFQRWGKALEKKKRLAWWQGKKSDTADWQLILVYRRCGSGVQAGDRRLLPLSHAGQVSTFHFLTCQHGQAKHRAFWHQRFTPRVLTDNSDQKEAWRGVIPGAPRGQRRAAVYSWGSRCRLASTASLFTPLCLPAEKMSCLASASLSKSFPPAIW